MSIGLPSIYTRPVRDQLEPWLRELLRTEWTIEQPRVRRVEQSTSSRSLLRVRSDADDLAVKVDADPRPEVLGGTEVQAHVHSYDRHLAAAVRHTRSGQTAANHAGQRVTVSDWVNGEHPNDSAVSWRVIGSALARLHSLPHCSRPFAIPVPAAARELYAQAVDYPFGRAFRDLVPRVRTLNAHPRGIIHGEINPANAIVNDSGEITLVDWDQAGVGPLALDLGYPLICVFISQDLHWNVAQTRSFYRAYRQHTQTLPVEPTDVFTAALLQAMRYLHFAHRDSRWARIQWAVAHESELLHAIEH